MKLEDFKKQMSEMLGDKYIDGSKKNSYEKKKIKQQKSKVHGQKPVNWT